MSKLKAGGKRAIGPRREIKWGPLTLYTGHSEERVSRLIKLIHNVIRVVPTAQGKRGKWKKKIPVRENTGNLEILPKHMDFGLLKF